MFTRLTAGATLQKALLPVLRTSMSVIGSRILLNARVALAAAQGPSVDYELGTMCFGQSSALPSSAAEGMEGGRVPA